MLPRWTRTAWNWKRGEFPVASFHRKRHGTAQPRAAIRFAIVGESGGKITDMAWDRRRLRKFCKTCVDKRPIYPGRLANVFQRGCLPVLKFCVYPSPIRDWHTTSLATENFERFYRVDIARSREVGGRAGLAIFQL